jgi:hypothetical protein
MPGRFQELFSPELLETLFPADRSDAFFEALYGDAEEGAYDIQLAFGSEGADEIRFEFRLRQRPGKCLACNLTHGLPHVFERHPILNVSGVVERIRERLNGHVEISGWRLGRTREESGALHVIPLIVLLEPDGR